MILTEQDLERALNKDYQDTLNKLVECADLMLKGNQMLVENKLSEKDHEILQEGLWEKAKYYMAKMGRYKAGGKIFGKGKVDQEAAAKIQSLLDKKGNEMIKLLNTKIKSENPEFPNNEKGDDFLKTVMEIAAVYDSVVAATKKKPEEEGYLPTDAANAIIADLAEYVKKFLDVDLAAAYTVMDSEEEKVKNKKDDDEDEESEEGEEELLTDDIEDINEDKAADVRKELQAKKGKDGVDRESIRFSKKGLASNRLPLFLNVAGGLLGLASWVTQTDWFKEMFTKLEQLPPKQHSAIINSYVNQHVGVDPKGFSYTLQNNLPKAPIDGGPSWANNAVGLKLGPNAPVENLRKAAEFYGQGDVNKGIEVMGKQFLDKSVQGDSIANLKAQLADTAKNKTVGDVFNHAEKTYGSSGELFKQANPASVKGFLVKILTSKVVTWMSTGATAASIPVGVAKLIAAGPVLAKVGVVLILTGAIVKLMRMKGKKQSRAKTLQDLLNSMQPVKAEQASLPPILPPPPNPAVEGEGKGGKVSKEGLFNDLAGFFKFTYNNRKMAAPGTFGDKKGEAVKENTCKDLKPGMEVMYNGKNKQFEAVVKKTEAEGAPEGEVIIQRKGNKGAQGVFGTDCSIVTPLKGKTEESVIKQKEIINEIMSNLIFEGKFIKDPEVIKMLKKSSGIDANKLKFFEGFITRIEIIRNKIKKMDNTGDKVIDKFVQKLKTNPIMGKDFVKTFNVDPGNPQNVENMGKFINELIEIVYKGNFRGMTFKDAGGMVSKMGTLGGGNINKVSMGESYLIERKGKKAKAKSDLKNHMISFITELMNMFQYMYKLKRQGKLGGESKSKEEKKGEVKKMGGEKSEEENPEAQQESIKRPENKFLKEEVRRIKSLMQRI